MAAGSGKSFCRLVAVGLVLLFAGAPSQARAQPSFQGLGFLPGTSQSQASGVSADGGTVVGWSQTAAGQQAFRWTPAGGMVGLGDLPGGAFSSHALGVSADGSVIVGGGTSASGAEAFRWTQAGGMVGLGDLPGGQFYSEAWGVSGDGSVAVGRSRTTNSGATQAFRWTDSGGMVGLGSLLPPNLTDSWATCVSGDGGVVAGISGSLSGTQAFRWTQSGGMAGLGYLIPGSNNLSEALGISMDGSAVVGLAAAGPSESRAFRWTASGGMVSLGDVAAGSFGSFATASSADGSVVVGALNYAATGQDTDAFIWDPAHGMRDLRSVLANDLGLNMSGWRLSQTRGISADGSTIVGYGVDPSGATEAWVAVVPEPGTAALVLVGAALCAGCRTRLRGLGRS